MSEWAVDRGRSTQSDVEPTHIGFQRRDSDRGTRTDSAREISPPGQPSTGPSPTTPNQTSISTATLDPRPRPLLVLSIRAARRAPIARTTSSDRSYHQHRLLLDEHRSLVPPAPIARTTSSGRSYHQHRSLVPPAPIARPTSTDRSSYQHRSLVLPAPIARPTSTDRSSHQHRSLVHEHRSLVHEHRLLVQEHRLLVHEHRSLATTSTRRPVTI